MQGSDDWGHSAVFSCALPPNSKFKLNLWCELHCLIRNQLYSKNSLKQNRFHSKFLKLEFVIQLIIFYGNIIMRFYWTCNYIYIFFIFVTNIICLQIYDLLIFVFHCKIFFYLHFAQDDDLKTMMFSTLSPKKPLAYNITHDSQLLFNMYYHLSLSH